MRYCRAKAFPSWIIRGGPDVFPGRLDDLPEPSAEHPTAQNLGAEAAPAAEPGCPADTRVQRELHVTSFTRHAPCLGGFTSNEQRGDAHQYGLTFGNPARDDSVLVLQHMGGPKFLVCTRNASQATKLMVAEGFRLNHERVAVEAVGPPVTYVNVYRLQAYVPDDTLTHALQQYGKFKSVNFATVANRQNKLNGVRVVKMEMSRPVPNFATIQGHRVMFEYRGMRRVCARCGEDGHMATACSSPYCKRCDAFGHETEGCEEECKRCGGRHGTRECFRRRSYGAAARGLPPINDNAPNREQVREPSSPEAVASTSGLQVLKPRSTPAAKRAPSY
ncbi:hypothetical protein HPB50_016266 [Hyalomma asiaticum]|uniref:Uncharacterized protein n=1 Tax=Hyalomma asiaticum TaxID=266040 RepID=A0ACB7S9B2_HYAAI|nr:hypothetical protein HPB50_016266 [Hyalomma asiaticum]